MPNLAYRRGIYHENTVTQLLRDNGYFVTGSKGSKGVADMVAVKPGQVLFVQVKSGKARLTSEGWNGLFFEARKAGAVPVVADKPARGRVRLRRVTAVHVAHSQDWPSEPFVVDEVA